MIYLKSLTLPPDRPDAWPYTIPALASIGELRFDAPITLLAGDNGTGKSTLLEALAVKQSMPAVGRVDAGRDDTLRGLRPFAKSLRLAFSARPTTQLFLRSEDFFNFVQNLSREQEEMRAELARVERETEGKSEFTKQQARAAYAGVLGGMSRRYGSDLLNNASHGESFLRLFQERLVPGGLYLLDEPEAPLSPLRQMSLHSIIKDLAQSGRCQFIIATHSPILLALDGAVVYDLEQSPPEVVSWQELPGVRLMKAFLQSPGAYTSKL